MACAWRRTRSHAALVLREDRGLVPKAHGRGGPARPRQRHQDVRGLRRQEEAVRLRHEVAQRRVRLDGLRKEDRRGHPRPWQAPSSERVPKERRARRVHEEHAVKACKGFHLLARGSAKLWRRWCERWDSNPRTPKRADFSLRRCRPWGDI